jgi:ectoine hydroxylase-related dioxygenase (phytanoyl-CoA dioxygenase family)
MSNNVSEIEERGFFILRDTFSLSEMEGLICNIEESGLRRSKAGIRHALQTTGVRDLAHDPRLLTLAAEIVGQEAIPFRATVFDKSPQSNWLVVWHQDTALPIRKRHDAEGWGPWSVKDGITYAHAPASVLVQVLALRVHLDESNADNGPLRVLPGTHVKGILSDDDIERLTEQIPAADCLVPRGGVLAMRPLTVHASSKSHSEAPRRVIHIEYAGCRNFTAGLELAIT